MLSSAHIFWWGKQHSCVAWGGCVAVCFWFIYGSIAARSSVLHGMIAKWSNRFSKERLGVKFSIHVLSNGFMWTLGEPGSVGCRGWAHWPTWKLLNVWAHLIVSCSSFQTFTSICFWGKWWCFRASLWSRAVFRNAMLCAKNVIEAYVLYDSVETLLLRHEIYLVCALIFWCMLTVLWISCMDWSGEETIWGTGFVAIAGLARRMTAMTWNVPKLREIR
jgi:hypothetical protein